MAVKKGYRQTPEHIRKRISARVRTQLAKPRGVSKEWLRAKYEVERLDCVKIGALVGRDPKTVWAWLKHYGIPTRRRGGLTSPHAFRKGHTSLFTGRKHSAETRQRLREIALADGRVPFDPKVGPPFRGKRGAETPNWKGGVTPERQAFYASDEWRSACKIVWARAKARCERCGIDHNTADRRGTFNVHHIVSFMVRELRATESNLALLCRPCHFFVHSRDNVDRAFIGEGIQP